VPCGKRRQLRNEARRGEPILVVATNRVGHATAVVSPDPGVGEGRKYLVGRSRSGGSICSDVAGAHVDGDIIRMDKSWRFRVDVVRRRNVDVVRFLVVKPPVATTFVDIVGSRVGLHCGGDFWRLRFMCGKPKVSVFGSELVTHRVHRTAHYWDTIQRDSDSLAVAAQVHWRAAFKDRRRENLVLFVDRVTLGF
jgi:hypothetical protein